MELRKDYVLDRWVIVSEGRSARPHQLHPSPEQEGVDYFAQGNEHLTPPERGRIVRNGGWQMRWFENKFPAVSPEGDSKVKTHNRFFTFGDAYGYHEVIVETPRSDKQLGDLPVEDIEQLLHVYARRICELEKDQNIQYVNVFKNHGVQAGTSIVHSHSQVIATAFIPLVIQEKMHAMKRFLSCPYCHIVALELQGVRKCFENEHMVAFTPYASRFNYEVWIFPKAHVARMEDMNFGACADILSKVLRKMTEANLDYNIIVQYGPKVHDFHFHIEVCPRKAIWAGFEFSSGVVINSTSPEDAARWYRGEL